MKTQKPRVSLRERSVVFFDTVYINALVNSMVFPGHFKFIFDKRGNDDEKLKAKRLLARERFL